MTRKYPNYTITEQKYDNRDSYLMQNYKVQKSEEGKEVSEEETFYSKEEASNNELKAQNMKVIHSFGKDENTNKGSENKNTDFEYEKQFYKKYTEVKTETENEITSFHNTPTPSKTSQLSEDKKVVIYFKSGAKMNGIIKNSGANTGTIEIILPEGNQ